MKEALFLLSTLFWFYYSFTQEIPDYFTDNQSAFTLRISGIPEATGELRIAMFNSEESYTKEPVHAVVLPADSTTIEWRVEALPFGKYAIAVYHDRNINGKLDTNFLGIPKESYGFSNGARGRFGPASWHDSVFEVKGDRTVHQIRVK